MKIGKDEDLQNCNFASCIVCLRNLVSDFEGGILTESFWKQIVEEDIWT
jgi:hypothetical protein